MATYLGPRDPKNIVWSDDFFQLFLARLKAVVSFFRDVSNAEEFCRQCRRAGHGVAAALVKSLALVSIAEWRWGALETVMFNLDEGRDTIVQHFKPKCFRNTADGAGFRKVTEVFASRKWRREFDFVLQMLQRIGKACR